MVLHIAPTRLLELKVGISDPESVLTACALTILFILASAFDTSFRIVSAVVLILTSSTTRLIVFTALRAAHSILLLAHSTVHNLWLALASSTLRGTIARHLENATPVLVLILTVLANWITLSSFFPCDASDMTGPPSPGPPKGRSPTSFSLTRGLPVLKLPSAETSTPRGKHERRYLETISSLEAKIARRAKHIEKLALKVDKARQAIGVRDASIADRDGTITKNAEAIVEKDASIARLADDGQHLRSDNTSVLSMLTQKAAHTSELDPELEAARGAEEQCGVGLLAHHCYGTLKLTLRPQQAVVDALLARIEVLEADLRTAHAEVAASGNAALGKATSPPEGAIALQEGKSCARWGAAVVLEDGLIACLQTDILKLQRELDSAHCHVVEKDALLAIQASTLDDLLSERNATACSTQAQTRVSSAFFVFVFNF